MGAEKSLTVPDDVLGAPHDGVTVLRFVEELGGVRLDVEDLDGEIYVTAASVGVCFNAHADDGKVHTAIMYAEGGEEDYASYPGSLPHGLRVTMSRAEIVAQIGRAPDHTGPTHDSWDSPSYRLIATYRSGTLALTDIALTLER